MPFVGNRLLPEALSKIVEKSDSSRQGRDTKRINPPKESVMALRSFFGLSAIQTRENWQHCRE